MSKGLKNIDTIIFDFDGTIADTLELGIKIANGLSARYRYKQINDREELDFYRSLSTQEAIKAIGISLVKLPFVASSFRKELSKSIDQLQPIKGISDIIIDLSKNYKLGIVTSNSKNNTLRFLEKNKLSEYFSYFSTGISLFKKYRNIHSLIKNNNLQADTILLVGDETRDIEAANKCGLPIVSVTWGFHTRETLNKFHPDYLIDNPKELSSLLSTNTN